jgi:hypothetical protein
LSSRAQVAYITPSVPDVSAGSAVKKRCGWITVATSGACAVDARAGLAWTATQMFCPTTTRPCGLLPILIVRVTRAERRWMRTSVPALRVVTHTDPSPPATAAGPPATGTVSATALVSGSMRFTRSSNGTATHTLPPATAIPLALRPTSIVLTISSVVRSMRRTVPSQASLTHTDPAPTATPAGSLPASARPSTRRVSASSRTMPVDVPAIQTASAVTATGRNESRSPASPSLREVPTLRNSGSITRVSERALSATHTPLGPAPSPSTAIPGEIVVPTRRERAPICVTLWSPGLLTQIDPPLTASSEGRWPTVTSSTTSPEDASTTATVFGRTTTASSPRVIATTATIRPAPSASPARAPAKTGRRDRRRTGGGERPPAARTL